MKQHFESFAQDLRFGLRTLRRNRGFAAVAAFTLALGIGAATLVFSVTDSLLLHVFPYRDASRLTYFYIHETRQGGYSGQMSPSVTQFIDVRQGLHTFEEIAGFWNRSLLYDNGQGSQEIPTAAVTTNVFPLLGVDPLAGRVFTAEDERPSAPPVCVIEYQFWQEQLHGDPRAVGSSLKLEGQPRTIIGIMPPRFQFLGVPVWLPYSVNAGARGYVQMIGRLRSGIALEAATADLTAAYDRLKQTYPADFPDKRFTVSLRTLTDASIGDFRRILYTLAAAAAILLLIACSNVANLLLVRATRREREIMIRAAVGATRLRLIRQLLVESFLLALLGGAAGCWLAYYAVHVFAVLAPRDVIPAEAVVALNSTALWFALAIAFVTTLLCGLAPAIMAVRGKLTSRTRLRGALVMAEVALSIILLVGAGLMTRTLFALTHVDLGFHPDNLLLAQLNVPRARYQSPDQQRLLVRQVLDRVAQTPGIHAASFALGTPPGSSRTPMLTFDIPGKPHPSPWTTAIAVSSEGYLPMLGRPLHQGRDFTATDVESARHLVIVNQTFARTFFSNENPIGRKMQFDFSRLRSAPSDPVFEIIGVVADAKNRGLREPTAPEALLVYTALPGQGLGILVKTDAAPLAMVETLRRQVWSVDSTVGLTHLTSIQWSIQDSYAESRFGLFSIAGFAAIGLTLAMVGIFSVMAYTVSINRREIGVRMALGAQPAQILAGILRKALLLAVSGIVIGMAVSLALTRLLATQLWGVSANDPMTLGGVAAILMITTLLACYVPARRAAATDPMQSLRTE